MKIDKNGLRIAGVGSYLPGPGLDQDQVRSFLRRYPDGLEESQQEQLIRDSGIEHRHFAIDAESVEKRESNTTMASAAAGRALDAAGWDANDVDLLVVTTPVPDQLMPPTSTLVQQQLGIEQCAEIEISANCTAPTKGLMFAASQLQLGAYKRALICNSQFASFGFVPPWMNPDSMDAEQGHLRWILSDGAGAIALEQGSPDIELQFHLESRGTHLPSGMSIEFGAAQADFAGAFASGRQHVAQNPIKALKNASRFAIEGLARMFEELRLDPASIDHFIPSISSVRVEKWMKREFGKLGVDPKAWRLNFTRIGYVGSVAIPIMLDELASSGELKPGDRVCAIAEESSKWMFAGSTFVWNP